MACAFLKVRYATKTFGSPTLRWLKGNGHFARRRLGAEGISELPIGEASLLHPESTCEFNCVAGFFAFPFGTQIHECRD
jgi:hypothetical protein